MSEPDPRPQASPVLPHLEKETLVPAIRHRTIQVAGVNVFVREAGEPARPALVLLHGFPSSSRQYVRLIDRLAGRWHVIAPDYPGFGLSDPVPDSPTFDRLAEITAVESQAVTHL